MKLTVFVTLTIINFVLATNTTDELSKPDLRLKINEFRNSDLCTTSSNVLGLCTKIQTCIRQGGTPVGTCGIWGARTCCTYGTTPISTTTPTPSDITSDITVVENPEYPSPHTTGGSYQYKITKSSSSVCQVQLQYLRLELAPEDAGSTTCSYDYLVVSNGAAISEKSCGSLSSTGDVFSFVGKNPIVLTISLSDDVYFNRIWNIEALPIEC